MGKLKEDVNKPFATVKACMEAGHTWEDCAGVTVKEGKIKGYIKRGCPVCMRRELQDEVMSGNPISFHNETEEEEKIRLLQEEKRRKE